MLILWWVVAGMVAGIVTAKIASQRPTGLLVAALVGAFGGVVGGIFMSGLGYILEGDRMYTVAGALVGGIVAGAILRLFERRLAT